MPLSLLDSQFATLEMASGDEKYVHLIDVSNELDMVVSDCVEVGKSYLIQ
ncbi:hypothetical protein L4C34_04270 [Vibrio profundum]